MTIYSILLSLTHRTTIERGEAELDDWNVPGEPDWATHLADVPCRVNMAAGRERTDEQSVVVVDDIRLLLPVDTDVTETDRIGDVTERGTTILRGPTGIRAVLRHRDHLELILIRLT